MSKTGKKTGAAAHTEDITPEVTDPAVTPEAETTHRDAGAARKRAGKWRAGGAGLVSRRRPGLWPRPRRQPHRVREYANCSGTS